MAIVNENCLFGFKTAIFSKKVPDEILSEWRTSLLHSTIAQNCLENNYLIRDRFRRGKILLDPAFQYSQCSSRLLLLNANSHKLRPSVCSLLFSFLRV